LIGLLERGRLLGLLGTDLDLFHRVADSRTPWLDAVLPRLSRSADHGMLWLGAAGVLGLTRGRRRRAAVRGLLAVGIASPLANVPAKLSFQRGRPPLDRVALSRRLRRQPSTLSFPSGHAASAAAFAVGVGLESPKVGAGVGVVAAAVAYSRVYTGVHYPGDVLAGLVLGGGCALLTTHTWPRRPVAPAKARSMTHLVPSLPEGEGLIVVVNRSSGKASKGTVVDTIRTALPRADVRVCDPEDVADALLKAAEEAPALGVVGGDGTVNAAARVALSHAKPLAVFPGGTLDHFAQDIGINDAADTAAAVRAGTAAAVDIGWVNGCETEIFLNTASLGGYPEIVATRERLEEYLGKWPSVALSLVRVLRTGEPLDLVVDGQRRRLWLLFAGNGSYSPSGFAPTYRADLTDRLLDIRMVDAEKPLSRARLFVAVLSGRLGRSRVYEQRLAPALDLRRADGTEDLIIALDGEVAQAMPELRLRKHPDRLLVYRPER
jgi:diacylglycerol kinase family enzyme/membrane-associated phospholipid phosphatase